LSDDPRMLGHALTHVVFMLKIHVFSRNPTATVEAPGLLLLYSERYSNNFCFPNDR
jgi:hypothetical protein